MEIDQLAAGIADVICPDNRQDAARIITEAIRKVCDPLQAKIDRLIERGMASPYFTKEQKLHREYIGDGVYAFFDGTGTPWLETEREFSSHYIAMEHAVINNWMGYLKRFLPVVPMCPLCGRLELKRPEAG